jgi:hypothetical protein
MMWPYHCSLFFSMLSMMSDFSFTPMIPFRCLQLNSPYLLSHIITKSPHTLPLFINK